MKTLYIECNMGAAGDMLMAALLELLPVHSAGQTNVSEASPPEREAFLKKLNGLVPGGVRVRAEESVKCGIKGTHVSVTVGDDSTEETSIDVDPGKDPEERGRHHGHDHHHEDHHHEHEDHHHGHEHHHEHHHAGLNDIEKTVAGLSVSEKVKTNIMGIYRLIAEAESRAHGRPVTEIHFHEVGSLDAVADITGVCMLMEELAPEKIVVSPVHVGSGFVRCAHGVLPVPAPATAFILSGVPSYSGGVKGELCTPTGAAILKHFADEFGPMPLMETEKIGYGMGKKDFEAANCVRVFLGQIKRESGASSGGPNGTAAELSCGIDDMTGEALGFACRTLMEAGAWDVFTTAAGMKKDRPGVILTCLCGAEKADGFAALMLKHTTTFGVRKTLLERYVLEREIQTAQTPFGTLRIKTGRGYGVTKSKVEYEDAAALAKAHNISIYEMEQKISAYLNAEKQK